MLIGFTEEEFTTFRSMMIAMEVQLHPSADRFPSNAPSVVHKCEPSLVWSDVLCQHTRHAQGDMVKLISCSNAMLDGTLQSAVESPAVRHEQVQCLPLLPNHWSPLTTASRHC